MALVEVQHDPFASEKSGTLTPVSHDPFKEPNEASVWEAMKKGFKQAIAPENFEDIARKAGPTAAERMAWPIKLATGAAKLPANVANLAGFSAPLNAVNAGNRLAEGITTAGGVKHPILSGTANLIGEIGTGSGALNLLGKAAAPIQAATPFLKPGITAIKGSPLAQSVLGGAALGAAGSESGSPMSMGKEALYGAGAGAIGHGAVSAVGHLLDPELLRLAKLKAAGFSEDTINKLSSGQFLGGKMQALENFLQDLPFGGAKGYINKGKTAIKEATEANNLAKDAELHAAKESINTAKDAGVSAAKDQADTAKAAIELQNRAQTQNINTDANLASSGLSKANENVANAARNDLAKTHADLEQKLNAHHDSLTAQQKESENAAHIPFINKALEPLGITVPEGMSGTQAMKFAQDAVSEAYNTALPQLKGLRLTKDIHQGLDDLSQTTHTPAKLGPYHAMFEADIQALKDSAGKGGWLNPENWQGNLSDLSGRAYDASSGTGDLFQKNYGKALRDLKDSWMGLIEDKAGSDAFKNANIAHSMLQAPQLASSYVKNVAAGGEFSPRDLLQAIKSGVSTKRFAGGEAGMQDLATQAHQDIMAGRQTLKDTIAENKQKFLDAKNADKEALEAKLGNTSDNVQNQQAYNKSMAGEQKQNLSDSAEAQKAQLDAQAKAEQDRIEKEAADRIYNKNLDIQSDKNTFKKAGNEAMDIEDPNEYWAKRVGYGIGLTGSLGSGALAHALNLSPVGPGVLAGGAYSLSRGLYNPMVQALIKKGATMERPEAVKQFGKVLKENAPLGGLSAVESLQQARQSGALPEWSGTPSIDITGVGQNPDENK